VIPHKIRPATLGDHGFIFGSWLGSLADECDVDRDDDKAFRAFKRSMRPTLEAIITRPGVTTLVACARADEDALMGWACGEAPSVLHFVYVAKPWREQKLGRALCEALKLTAKAQATHYTSWGFPRVARMFEDLTFDPTLLIAER
jgi:GNAT superfamily N-acetyltransferase